MVPTRKLGQGLEAYYSSAGRYLERELGPLLNAEKMGLLVWSPLAGGLLSGKFSRDNQSSKGARRSKFDFPIVDKERAWNVIDVMRPIADARGCSPARIALAWLLAKPVVTSVIVGAKELSQLKHSIAAIDITLSDQEILKLDAASELPRNTPVGCSPTKERTVMALSICGPAQPAPPDPSVCLGANRIRGAPCFTDCTHWPAQGVTINRVAFDVCPTGFP